MSYPDVADTQNITGVSYHYSNRGDGCLEGDGAVPRVAVQRHRRLAPLPREDSAPRRGLTAQTQRSSVVAVKRACPLVHSGAATPAVACRTRFRPNIPPPAVAHRLLLPQP